MSDRPHPPARRSNHPSKYIQDIVYQFPTTPPMQTFNGFWEFDHADHNQWWQDRRASDYWRWSWIKAQARRPWTTRTACMLSRWWYPYSLTKACTLHCSNPSFTNTRSSGTSSWTWTSRLWSPPSWTTKVPFSVWAERHYTHRCYLWETHGYTGYT